MKLREIREKKGLTQEQVAEGAGISRVAYTNIETGRRRPSIPVARKLAAVLEIEWTVFYDETTDSL